LRRKVRYPKKSMNPQAAAAARLHYAGEVRARTRRALLEPSFALLALGTVVAVHGALAALWPHDAGVAASWLPAVLAARVAVARRRRRVQWRRGMVAAPGLRRACAAIALVAAVAAIALGASPLVTGIAAVTAAAAYLGGLPSIAAAALLTGAIGDVVLLEGAAQPAGELLFGLGLVAVGLACRAVER
jgi:hypothetical protein